MGSHLIFGDPAKFAIESEITTAFEDSSLKGIGYFVLHVGGHCFGVQQPEATYLALPLDGARKLVSDRGTHIAPFSAEPDAGVIADAYHQTLYSPAPEASYFGIPTRALAELLRLSQIGHWTGYSDEAFDDGSYILHFDNGQSVRLIAFQSGESYHHAPGSLRDILLAPEDYYGVAAQWADAFHQEWSRSQTHKGIPFSSEQ